MEQLVTAISGEIPWLLQPTGFSCTKALPGKRWRNEETHFTFLTQGTTSEVLHITDNPVSPSHLSQLWHILYILSRKAVWAFSDWIFEHAQQVNANIEFCRLPHEISFQFPNTALSTPPWPTLAQTCQWCQSSRCSDELCSDRSTYAQRSKEIQSQFQYHCHHSC